MPRPAAVLLLFICFAQSTCIHQNERDNPNIADPPPDASVGLTPRCIAAYKCGYVDRRGKFVIPPAYKIVRSFYEGLASVYVEGTGWGVIDSNGSHVVEASFASIGPFSEGLAAACPSQKNLYLWVYIDRAGRTAIELKYNVEQAFPYHDGTAWVRCPFLFSSQMKQIDVTGKVLRRMWK